MDLSYPALKGASGAPVFGDHGRVCGVIVANREQLLEPAQVERVFSEDGKLSEEVRYFLPTAKAIAWKHIEDVLGDREEEYPGGFKTKINQEELPWSFVDNDQ